jgi:hypothetical protein
MTALTTSKFGALASRFAGKPVVDDLGTGIQTGFGVIGTLGKVWSIRFRGENFPLMRPDNTGPVSSIEVVIVKAATVISKLYYVNQYVKGSTDRPDCFSTNGVVPDPTAPKKQHANCTECPQNQWGARITPAGKKAKACNDVKRLAVVPLQDIANESFGGPLLLRVPPATLQDLALYGSKLNHQGYPYFAVATRISFDHTVAHQKYVFDEIRALTDDEADLVLKHQNSAITARILSESIDQSVVAESSDPAFGAPEPVAANPSPPAPASAPSMSMPTMTVPTSAGVNVGAFGGTPATTARQAAPPAPASNGGSFETNLDAELDKLLPK